MKNTLNICNLLILLTFFSCSEEKYSCDPDVNKWVNQNMEKIKEMTRTDWLEIADISYQRGTYNAFSIDQQANLWIDKMDELLKLDWSLPEYEHLITLRTAISKNQSWFQPNKFEESEDEEDLFEYQWVDYAENKLNWKEELIYAIAYTPLSIDSNKILIQASDPSTITSSIKTRSEIGQILCDCNNPGSAHYLTCGSSSHDCLKGDDYCKERTGGCGWLWSEKCNGLCHKKLK